MTIANFMFEPLRKAMATHGLDAAAIVPGANFRRLLKRDFHLMERPFVVIVPAEGRPAAIVPQLELASFKPLGFDGRIFAWRDEDGYRDAFAEAAAVLPQLAEVQSFGLEAERMRAFEMMALQRVFPEARLVDAHQAISSIRLHKTADEIALLKQAITISEAALEATLAQVRIGMTEKQIESVLLNELFSHGADGLAFEPIVAAGDNSAQPHAHARDDYQVKAGDALLFDFGASWHGYNADITRTFFVAEVSDRDRRFYETVAAANTAGKEATKPGATAHHVDDTVQNLLEELRICRIPPPQDRPWPRPRCARGAADHARQYRGAGTWNGVYRRARALSSRRDRRAHRGRCRSHANRLRLPDFIFARAADRGVRDAGLSPAPHRPAHSDFPRHHHRRFRLRARPARRSGAC